MRQAIRFAALLILGSFTAVASAAPNVFWTFGFDLPLHGPQAPHFGEIVPDGQLAGMAQTGSVAAPGASMVADVSSDPGNARLGSIVMVAAHGSRIPINLR